MRSGRRIRRSGAAVVGIDTPAWLARAAAAGGGCTYFVADLERLSHELERALGADMFSPPVVAGEGLGGAVALDLLAQTPQATLGAVIAVDPAAAAQAEPPLCPPAARRLTDEGAAYHLPSGAPPAPLTVVLTPKAPAGGAARVRALKEGGVTLTLRTADGPAKALDAAVMEALLQARAEAGAGPDLPVVELPAEAKLGVRAIVLSGDGGWRDLDRSVATVLQADGAPVIGIDSLRYFWTKRTPEETAADLARLIARYRALWGVGKVALIGYSFGADVLPETCLALPDETRAKVAQITLLAPSVKADWEITVADCWAAHRTRRPTPPAPRPGCRRA